jgi:hypothetical protein
MDKVLRAAVERAEELRERALDDAHWARTPTIRKENQEIADLYETLVKAVKSAYGE